METFKIYCLNNSFILYMKACTICTFCDFLKNNITWHKEIVLGWKVIYSYYNIKNTDKHKEIN